jgi:uncharacterized protein YndB with AHSA1/START domain
MSDERSREEQTDPDERSHEEQTDPDERSREEQTDPDERSREEQTHPGERSREESVVRVQRVLPATPEEVFDEWLDPEALKEWMCPRPSRCVAVAVEPRVGGRVRLDVDTLGSLVLITGQFLDVDRPNLLRFTWSHSGWADPTITSIVNVAFEAVGDDETLMSIEHSLLPVEALEDHHHGWTVTVDQLEALLPR